MSSPSTKNAGTVSSDSGNGGAVAWVNPTNAQGSTNASFATADVSGLDVSEWLKFLNFGHSLVSGDTVLGIQFGPNRKASNTGATEVDGKIVKGGVASSTNKASGGAIPTTLAYPSPLFGGTADLCGETWAYTDINSNLFGFVYSVTRASSNRTVSVDDGQTVVTYSSGGGGGGAAKFLPEALALNPLTGLYRTAKLIGRKINGTDWFLGNLGIVLPFSRRRIELPILQSVRHSMKVEVA